MLGLKMKQTKNNIRKMNILFFLLVSLCAIIFIMIKTIADDNLNMRQVRYQLGSTVNYEFSFYTDSPKFHTKASGYEKYKGMDTENNMNSIMATDMVKMQGYGNYEFKPDTNLFSFIDYCYSKDPAITMACAYRAGTTEANTWDYTKLMSYRDSSVNTSFFKYFWQNMSNSCPNFKDYQDDFFFLNYTYPATQKIGINLAMMRNLSNDGESLVEYLTCLTSYIFSITPQAQVNGMTFGKGDVVPFLYFKDRKHANIDVRHDSEALMDIAKYAYVALIEGWCTLPTPYHLWENEYNWLFGNYEPENLDYDLETLHQWYDETYQRYCKDKGRKGNNLLGSTIEHIIESDYSIEQQLEATEYYIRGIFSDLGIETDFKETMARNELMAKYMMEHSNFDDTIKDYNVTIKFMTENLQRGTHEEQNTHTVVTSDFQVLEFPYTMDKRNINHSDEDGISDGAELGNEKWINITEFVRKTYEDAKLKGEPHKATFEEQVEDIIEKNGAYTDFGGNKVYGSVKWNDDKTKVLYRVYDYKSNPKLNDTDFDGLNDNIDNKPLNNYHNVKMDIEESRRLSMTHGSEYRHFAGTPNKYNSELAQMSLLFSNIANGSREIDIDQDLNGYLSITQYMQTVGFLPLTQVNLLNGKGKAYIGFKELQYYNNKKYIIGIFIGGFTDKNSFQELLFDTTGLVEEKFSSIANAIKNQLDYYRSLYLGKEYCYFITGMDIAGGVANVLACELNDEEVYCYTFDPPNISKEDKGVYTYIKNIVNEDSLIPKAYNKNDGYHINGDIYNQSIRYDIEYRSYLRDELKGYKGDYKISNSLKDEINNIKITYVNDNNINEFFREISEKLYGNRLTPVPIYMYNSKGKINYMHLYEDKYEYDIKYLKKCGFIDDLLTPIGNIMYGMVEAINKTSTNIKDASETEVKSVEAGEINGFDKEDHYDDKVDEVNSDNEDSTNKFTDVVSAIEKSAVFYINNVATYQSELKTGGTEKRARETNIARDTLKPYLNIISDIPNNTQILEDNKILYTFIDSNSKVTPSESIFIDNIKNRKMFPNTNSNNDIYSNGGHLWYKWIDEIDHAIEASMLNNISYTRDDCSGFAKLVTILSNNGKNINIYDSEHLLYYTDPVSDSLLNNGYEMYVLQGAGNDYGKWKKVSKINGAIATSESMELSLESLRPGDMLISYEIKDNGSLEYHTEYYVGYDYPSLQYNKLVDEEPDKNKRKKYGIKEIGVGIEIPISNGRAAGTFGWGDVNDEFPTENKQGNFKHYFNYNTADGSFRHCECGNDPNNTSLHSNCKYNKRKYTVIWRKS